ncbi:hypothetical protein QBC32DRAFT_376932 [Pseudoneurospora amorphoporcata]|uniref:Uncharacterized protein n=1 Tax=Pseudoneurospora amorphoporcata TaxID=241081 RepID=A0AAN6NUN5_9PEZI|nr:hypothetical protein QBC32DRAFT_376932 [Pseudoneurospora amorphoporcata]
MSLPKVTPTADSKVDSRVEMPANPAEVIPSPKYSNQSPIISSPTKAYSYSRALTVAVVIEMTKNLNLDSPTRQSMITIKNGEELKSDDTATCTQDIKAFSLDNERIGTQQDEVTCAPGCGSDLEDSPTGNTSTSSTNSSTMIVAKKLDKDTLVSAQPVPVVYPPRRRNIFSKSAPQRNVQWSKEILATIPTHATEDSDNDEDGFTMEELRQFRAEGKEKMERKTEGFLRTVGQYSWRPRVVEDLGEVFELED